TSRRVTPCTGRRPHAGGVVLRKAAVVARSEFGRGWRLGCFSMNSAARRATVSSPPAPAAPPGGRRGRGRGLCLAPSRSELAGGGECDTAGEGELTSPASRVPVTHGEGLKARRLYDNAQTAGTWIGYLVTNRPRLKVLDGDVGEGAGHARIPLGLCWGYR